MKKLMSIFTIAIAIASVGVNMSNKETIATDGVTYDFNEYELVTDTYKIIGIEKTKKGIKYRCKSINNNFQVGINDTETTEKLNIGNTVVTESSCILGHITVDKVENTNITKRWGLL